MFAIITIPAAADIVASTTANATAYFSEFFVYVLYAIGLTFAVLAAVWLKNIVLGGLRKILGGKRRGRRKGR